MKEVELCGVKDLGGGNGRGGGGGTQSAHEEAPQKVLLRRRLVTTLSDFSGFHAAIAMLLTEDRLLGETVRNRKRHITLLRNPPPTKDVRATTGSSCGSCVRGQYGIHLNFLPIYVYFAYKHIHPSLLRSK